MEEASLDEDAIGGDVDWRAVEGTKRSLLGVAAGATARGGGGGLLGGFSCSTIVEVVCGAVETSADLREGPEERLAGATAILAISRPSSPIRL